MGLALVQRQALKLKMTPALYQSVAVLQCNNEELTHLIREKALENPLLNVADSDLHRDDLFSFKGAKSTSDVIAETQAQTIDFRERLHRELHQMRLEPCCIEATDLLIDSLNDNGYLDEAPDAILDPFAKGDVDPQQALALLQSLDPAGVGARSLIECLCLQLRRLESRSPLAETLLTDYRDCFLSGDWSELAEQMDVTKDEINAAVAQIRRLNPNPVAAIQEDPPQYIIPDVTIVQKGDRLVCELEDQYLPTVSINNDDYQMYLQASDKETKRYLREKMEEADALISGLSRRKQTMMQLAELVMQRQEAYFSTGERTSLRPFTMKQAAKQLAVHESTISRAAAGKYVQTNHGIVPMRQFFIRAVGKNQTALSAYQIQDEIKKLINQEDPRRPLSDQIIAGILGQSGIKCSRRAVAKYRQRCGIGSTIERRAVARA
ncbi:RNA polymerase factor sigma-54 [Sporolactobacillus terrae]|uniref:RNA polymerase factor sigma-54 n=1 Tax=Sporolactobacillus terrae TaxID=269673 RepID=UPI00048A484B|nr:RNA polymerase factor sigma-54 [Sporolactobacillus terrae]